MDWAITHFLSVGRIDTSSQCRLRSTRAERLSCATEELRQLLVRPVEHRTFSRWPPIPRRNADRKFSCSQCGVSGSSDGNQGKERSIDMFGKGRVSESKLEEFAVNPRRSPQGLATLISRIRWRMS